MILRYLFISLMSEAVLCKPMFKRSTGCLTGYLPRHGYMVDRYIDAITVLLDMERMGRCWNDKSSFPLVQTKSRK